MKDTIARPPQSKFGTDGKRTSEILKELATELDKLGLEEQPNYVRTLGGIFVLATSVR